ncbi:MAG: cell division protein FtsQ/DivIB [Paracoccaceae bacterium]
MQSLARTTPLRRDPSPSRWAYKVQRLWLTPAVRVAVRFGVPALLAALVLAAVLGAESRRAAMVGAFDDLRESFESRPEFRVSLIRVVGASSELADAVRARLGLRLPLSSFDLDLDQARARIESLDAVDTALLRLRSGGVLEVVITERVPALVWRVGGALMLLDDGGHRVAGLAARADRADLPLIAGPGAERAAPEAMAIYAAAQPILPRLRGLVRVGERRWDLVLDREQTILLPQDNPVAALERLLALDVAEDILARDILSVDLRHDARPTLRLSRPAWARMNGLEPEADQETLTESEL